MKKGIEKYTLGALSLAWVAVKAYKHLSPDSEKDTKADEEIEDGNDTEEGKVSSTEGKVSSTEGKVSSTEELVKVAQDAAKALEREVERKDLEILHLKLALEATAVKQEEAKEVSIAVNEDTVNMSIVREESTKEEAAKDESVTSKEMKRIKELEEKEERNVAKILILEKQLIDTKDKEILLLKECLREAGPPQVEVDQLALDDEVTALQKQVRELKAQLEPLAISHLEMEKERKEKSFIQPVSEEKKVTQGLAAARAAASARWAAVLEEETGVKEDGGMLTDTSSEREEQRTTNLKLDKVDKVDKVNKVEEDEEDDDDDDEEPLSPSDYIGIAAYPRLQLASRYHLWKKWRVRNAKGEALGVEPEPKIKMAEGMISLDSASEDEGEENIEHACPEEISSSILDDPYSQLLANSFSDLDMARVANDLDASFSKELGIVKKPSEEGKNFGVEATLQAKNNEIKKLREALTKENQVNLSGADEMNLTMVTELELSKSVELNWALAQIDAALKREEGLEKELEMLRHGMVLNPNREMNPNYHESRIQKKRVSEMHDMDDDEEEQEMGPSDYIAVSAYRRHNLIMCMRAWREASLVCVKLKAGLEKGLAWGDFQSLELAWRHWIVTESKKRMNDRLASNHANQRRWDDMDRLYTAWRECVGLSKQDTELLTSSILFMTRTASARALSDWKAEASLVRNIQASDDLAKTVRRYNQICESWNIWWESLVESRRRAASRESLKHGAVRLLKCMRKIVATSLRAKMSKAVRRLQLATLKGAHIASFAEVSTTTAEHRANVQRGIAIIALLMHYQRRGDALSKAFFRMAVRFHTSRDRLMSEEVQHLSGRIAKDGANLKSHQELKDRLTRSQEAVSLAWVQSRLVRQIWSEMNCMIKSHGTSSTSHGLRKSKETAENLLKRQVANSELVLQLNRRKRAWLAHKEKTPRVSSENSMRLTIAVTWWKGVVMQWSLTRALDLKSSKPYETSRRRSSILDMGKKQPSRTRSTRMSSRQSIRLGQLDFDKVDENKDGVIDREEYESIDATLDRLGYPP